MLSIRRVALLLAVTAGLAFPAVAQTSARATVPGLGTASHVIIPPARSFAVRPRPEDPTRPAGIRLEKVAARVTIRDQVASTTLDIFIRNTSSRPEEAVLLLPVPDGAVVSGFTYDGPASEPTAQTLTREEARRLFDAIVARILDPALLEFAGYNLVRSSVFPVPAGGAQRLQLTYEHLLESDGGRLDYLLPRSESLDQRTPWQIDVAIESEHPISTVYSPSHEIDAERVGPNRFRVTLDGSTAPQPGPYRLAYLREVDDGVSTSLFAYPDPEVGGGYLLLMAGLPAKIDETRRLRREITVVIDRSASMAGPKMDQVRAAALQVIEGLDDGEAFNIIDYASTVARFAPAPVIKDRAATLEARDYLGAIGPGGGTNIHDALLEALRQPATDGMLPIVLFLTDGLPTIGRTSEVTIREMVEKANVHRRRVFTFGVGEDVNVPLLDRVATITRATSDYVLPDEDVEVKLARVARRLYGPVFAEPELRTTDTSGAASTRLVQEIIPAALPDLFEGDQLILLAQYRTEEPVTFELTGNYLGAERTFRFDFDPARATTGNAFVPRLWASRRIAFLIDQIRQAGAETSLRPNVVGSAPLADPRSRELVDEILRLSTRFGILTEYTAFLATEGTDLGDLNALRVGCSSWLEDRAVRTRTGIAAVNQALNTSNQIAQTSLNYGNTYLDAQLNAVQISNVQHVSDRAFFRRGNRWIDSRLAAVHATAQPDRVLMIGSEEHFRLLWQLTNDGRQGMLALTGEILLLVDGEIVLVTDGC